jgi:lipoprotein-anchoring transpeptidase ErfK/SrfK
VYGRRGGPPSSAHACGADRKESAAIRKYVEHGVLVKKLVVVLVVLAVLLGGAGAGAYAYDSKRSDVIADGVTIAGVDVGGLRADAARAVLERRIVSPLRRPVSAHYGNGAFVLSAEQARARTDLAGMVERALERSRAGNFVTRTVRELTDQKLDARVRLRTTYSKAAVRKFVARIERAIYEPPREARMIPSTTSLTTVPSKDGLGVRTALLTRAIERELVDPRADRDVRVRTEVVEPKTTTAELPKKYPYFIAISRPERKLRLFRNLELVKVYDVAIGAAGFDTPAGLHRVETKAADPAWYVPNKPWAGKLAGKVIPAGDPRNPIAARWMGFYDGAGIHGTYDPGSIGSAASHGCIRMRIRDVKQLYDRVPLHTPIYIA